MRTSWVASVIGGLLVGGLPAVVFLGDADQPVHDHYLAAATVGADSVVDGDDKRGNADETAEMDVGRRGQPGPPPWAHAPKDHGQHVTAHPNRAWKDAWKKLTPAQRVKKMAALAKAHAVGMQKWADCASAARGDATKRAECEKPLPPGLARRLL